MPGFWSQFLKLFSTSQGEETDVTDFQIVHCTSSSLLELRVFRDAAAGMNNGYDFWSDHKGVRGTKFTLTVIS